LSRVFPYLDKAKVKGKLYTIKCHEGLDEKKSYSSTLTLTSAVGGDGWSTSHPGEESRYPFVQEAGWGAGPVWMGKENRAPLTGIRSPDRPGFSESLYRLCCHPCL